jgi:hypothetical protein
MIFRSAGGNAMTHPPGRRTYACFGEQQVDGGEKGDKWSSVGRSDLCEQPLIPSPKQCSSPQPVPLGRVLGGVRPVVLARLSQGDIGDALLPRNASCRIDGERLLSSSASWSGQHEPQCAYRPILHFIMCT